MANSSEAPTRRNRRGLETRRRVLEGGVSCLNSLGYAATTVEAVMRETGLSRGSILNQFPNRTVLMIELTEYAMQVMIDHSRHLREQHDDPVELVFGYLEIIWQAQLLPEATAVTELLLAARWDSDLAAGLKVVAERIESVIGDESERIARNAGIADVQEWRTYVHMMVLSLRGIRLETMFDANREIMQQALARMRLMHNRHCERLLPGGQAD